MLEKIEHYGSEMCQAKEIIFTTYFSPTAASINLPMQSRMQIYLILKESINNAVKYSNAASLQLTMEVFNSKLQVTVKDNGSDFDATTVTMGNGIENMCKRAAEINALFKIDSQKDDGTSIRLTVSLLQSGMGVTNKTEL